jgi:virulence factor Mce-like protein
MPTQKTKFTVGVFIASGIGIILIVIIWLGMTSFMRKGQFYATYFNESVQGLEVDSLVKYRGVPIGRVESIGVAPDSKLIQVVLKLDSGQKLGPDMVAQLKIVGITGSMFVEMDRKKKDEPDLSPEITFPSEYPIVATKPSDISQLLAGIDDVLKQIKSLDLGEISSKVKTALDNINGVVADNKTNIGSAIGGFGEAVGSAKEFFDKGTALVDQLAPVAENLERASENLNRAIDALADQPSKLLFGNPPPSRKVEPDRSKR